MPPELLAALGEALREMRQARAEELRALADVLLAFDLAADVGPILAAASEALGPLQPTTDKDPDPGRWYWGYVIDGLQLRLDDHWKRVPKSAVFDTSALTIRMQEYVPSTADLVAAGYPNLRRADVDFSLEGLCEHAEGIAAVRSAWHIDTHLYSEPTSTAHPKHHFQFGGDLVEDLDENVRALWVPDTPRLLTFPLDGILAVDFVLSHYAGKGWMEAQQDQRYLTLRRAAALRYWRPVAEILAGFFGIEKRDAGEHAALKLLPNLAWV